MNKPPILYKYIGYSDNNSACAIRCSFLEDGLFRYSQVSALNDPFEATPRVLIDKYSTEDIEIAKSQAELNGMSNLPESEIINMYLSPYPKDRMDEKLFPGLWPWHNPKWRDEPFKSIKEVDEFLVKKTLDEVYHDIDETYGLFCLSEPKDNVLMWSHYAESHKGIVIGFDASHSYFNTNGFLGSIEYSDERASISVNGGIIRICGMPHDINKLYRIPLIYRKSKKWNYEKEWRFMTFLSNRTRRIDDIFLFRIPHEIVKEIIFGAKARDNDVLYIYNTVRSNSRYSHIEFYKAELNSSTDCLNIVKY